MGFYHEVSGFNFPIQFCEKSTNHTTMVPVRSLFPQIIGSSRAKTVRVLRLIYSNLTLAWWLIPLSKWVITPVISGLTLLIPFITGVITHLLSGMSHQVGDVPWPSGWQFYYSSSGKMPSALNMFGIKCSKTFSIIAFPMRGTKLRPPDAQTLPIQKTIGKALEHGYFMLQKSSLASAPDALSVAFRAGDRHAGIHHVVASALACPTRNEDKGLKWVHTLGDTFLPLLLMFVGFGNCPDQI